jgi:CelD/BcsL family acetyltransferase involved in cellulose biosynthesis
MSGPAIIVEAITTRDAIGALAKEWEVLLASAGEQSPFVTPDWIDCCLDHAPARPPHVLVARSDGTVTGIAPLWLGAKDFRGISVRTLSFIASSETPETDLIVNPEAREATIRAFVRYFYEGKPAIWDAVFLGQWPADSPNAKTLNHLLQASRRAHFAGVSSIVPYVPIAGDWEAFWQSRSYLFRKSRRGILNRLKRLGEIEVLALGGDRAEEALRLYLHVSERGWKQAEGLSAGSRPELRKFFESLTRTAGRRGWLRVWVLRIGGEAVAVEYHIEAAGRVHALRADYDEAWAAHSPGACLEYHILRQLFAEGYREYSTGPGTDDYKRRWTEHERTNVSLTLCRKTPRGLGVWFLEGVVLPALRRARRRLRPTEAKAA